MLKYIFLAALFFSFTSCIPDVMCANNTINPVLVGFASSDIDTLILRRYKSNDNYNTLIDTMLIVNAFANNGLGYALYTTTQDTTIVFVNVSSPRSPIAAGYDWRLYIPATNRTISISDIVNDEEQGKKGCIAPISSYIQDGRPIDAPLLFSTDKFYTSGYRAYIHS